MKYLKGFKPTPSMIVSIIALVVACAGGAYAAATISGQDIVNESVKSKDIKNKALKKKDLNKKLLASLGAGGTDGTDGSNGTTGPRGPAGADGEDGEDGADAVGNVGDVFSSEMWGVIERNSFGSPVAEYRLGPWGPANDGTVTSPPPIGDGSLALRVDDKNAGDPAANENSAEGVNFGSEVEFTNQLISEITTLDYGVFYGDSTTTLPNLKFEIDSDLINGDDYTTLTYQPPARSNFARATWVTVDATVDNAGDNQDGYVMSGAEAATCPLADPCTFQELQTALPDTAKITLSGGIGFGRGGTFVGAVDAFQVNNQVFDFELTGTNVTTP